MITCEMLIDHYLKIIYFAMTSNLQNAHKNNVKKFCIPAIWCMNVYGFARDGVTRYHRLDDLNNRNISFHSSGKTEFKSEVGGQGVGRVSSLGGL